MFWTIAVIAYLVSVSLSSLFMLLEDRYRIVAEDVDLLGKRVVLPEGRTLDFP